MKNYISIAEQYRNEQTEEHFKKGVVLIWDGQAYGWKNKLRNPEHEQPGAIAVDNENHVFIAEGGDSYNGVPGKIPPKKTLLV